MEKILLWSKCNIFVLTRFPAWTNILRPTSITADESMTEDEKNEVSSLLSLTVD